MTTRFYDPLSTRRLNLVPGDQTPVLTRPASDADGVEYPKGTRLVPLCGGASPSSPTGSYQDVTIIGDAS
jgi:hypothetical protein